MFVSMKKRVSIILLLCMVCLLLGTIAFCRARSAAFADIDSWPQTELTSLVPEPVDGRPIRYYSQRNSESVVLAECTLQIYDDYISSLTQDGFLIQKSAEDADSKVTLLIKGTSSIQVSYSNGNILIAISTKGFRW